MILPDSMLHFLSALGNGILNSFWQLGLMWMLVTAISRFKNNINPELLSHISFLGLLTGFVSFCITVAVSLYTPQTEAGIFGQIWSGSSLVYLMNGSALLYLIILTVPLTKFFIGYKKVYDLKKSKLRRAPGHYKIFLLDMAAHLGIKKKIGIWISELAETPLTLGFFKPVILLPISVVNQLTPNQVEAIILHELAHIKKNDYIINFISQVLITFLYFNPFARALVNIYNAEREKSADSRVLQFEYNNHMYATTLLQLAQQNMTKRNSLAIEAAGNKSQLFNRVEWIMGLRQRPYPDLKKMVASMSLIIAIFMFSLTNQSSKTEKIASAIVGKIETKTAEQFAYSSVEDKKDDYKIEQIPASADEDVVKIKAVYLKQVENPETGKLEVAPPAEEESSAYVFAGATEIAIPKLTKEQEVNVQQSISAAKKLFAENNWQHIERSLAETVTTEQKLTLKEVFKSIINEANWNDQANLLRLEYNNINWEKTKADLNLEVAYVKLDSVYNHYSSALEKYNALKKEMTDDKKNEINLKIANTRMILMKADSIRKKRIVEL